MVLSQTNKVRLLYKTILKLHRGLPKELQPLGNNYVRDEFKRHKKCSEHEAQIFMNSWTDYALNLAKQLGLRGKPGKQIGIPLDIEVLEHFQSDQIVQLYELMKAAKNLEDDNVPQTK